ELLATLGAPSDALEQITEVLLPPSRGEKGLIIRTRQPHDFKRVASFFPAGTVEKRHAGQVYYQTTTGRPRAFFFPDDRTAIIAPREADLHLFIDAGKTGAAQAGWAKDWKEVQNQHFAVVVD